MFAKQRNFAGLRTCFPNIRRVYLRLTFRNSVPVKDMWRKVKQVGLTELCYHMDSSPSLTTVRATWSIVLQYDDRYLSHLTSYWNAYQWNEQNLHYCFHLMLPNSYSFKRTLTPIPSTEHMLLQRMLVQNHAMLYRYEQHASTTITASTGACARRYRFRLQTLCDPSPLRNSGTGKVRSIKRGAIDQSLDQPSMKSVSRKREGTQGGRDMWSLWDINIDRGVMSCAVTSMML
ncbi:hypothetical protein EV421DRAFT_2018446 [Armillaria borealis]|uniref:Uncharacterized protein n=1 Tax=Armillaria borealis TaxID=47425 RepID=A0AA39MTB1_9AGAR|nr:hypothetical protein EV421DRAFT_2018446 [Armillaria borealis]